MSSLRWLPGSRGRYELGIVGAVSRPGRLGLSSGPTGPALLPGPCRGSASSTRLISL